MQLGFIGLGNMGQPMAANLLRAGHELTVYNRTRSRAEALGARVAEKPSDAATGQAVITMLADDDAVEQVDFGADGIMSTLSRTAIHVSMSTISVALAERLSSEHARRGQRFMSAPVFGRPEAAAAAKLFVVAAGDESSVQTMLPVFETLGQKTFTVGQRPSMANAVKLSGNFLIASMIETLGEAFALVRKHDVPANVFLEVLTNSLFNAPVYRTYGGIIAASKYEPVGFRLALGLKDVRLALDAAERAAVPMPVASVLRDRFLTGVANGMSDADWSVIARLVAESAGLKS
jgi:3-hydroxyisobutyrate dehydrogenase-like beta-hydroxyacid dehydrogenase